ncbi:type I methionyl aminopeptidase [Patescibacteria group bacterium]
MIRLKSQDEIKILQEGGKRLSDIMRKLKDAVKPGVNSIELEETAKKLIKKAGGEPAFLGYEPISGKKYPAALCLSINEAVVHTPASISRDIKQGEIVSLDLGFKYKGLITDMATTVIVGKGNAREKELLLTTKKALEQSIKECKAGKPISIIGKKIQKIVSPLGFNIVKDLVGHGVGYEVHEEPIVPNYYIESLDSIIMEEGLIIAIEPMITIGDGRVELSNDNWTYKTVDNSIAAHFEATVAITKNGPLILTSII